MTVDRDQHLASLWEDIADALGDAVALIHGSRRITWSDFDDRSARFSGFLEGRGLEPGAVVAIYLYNCPEYFEVFHGAIKAELVPANVNYRYVDDELVSLLENSGASVLVFDSSLAERVERVRAGLPNLDVLVQVGEGPVAPGVTAYEDAVRSTPPAPRRRRGDGFYLSYTGGTTGLPKGVMYNIERATINGYGLRDSFLGRTAEPDEDPVALARELRAAGRQPVSIAASPLMHSTAFIFASLPTLQAGGAIVTLESRSFDAHELWRVVEQERATIVAIVGDAFARPALRALEEAVAAGTPYDTSSLQVICSAGVAWSASVKEGLLEHVPQLTLVDACGSTEGATYGLRRVSKGVPAHTANFDRMPGVMVVDADGDELPDGEVGLLASPTPSDGYLNDPERSAKAYRMINGVQYTIPGDFGRIEPDGTLTLIGRGTSTINTGGEKVHPEEVEDVIKNVDGVDDCIVFGAPDERFGQKVVAAVQVAPGVTLDAEDIGRAVREKLAGYKAPRRVLFVARMPRSPNGKPDFTALSELVET